MYQKIILIGNVGKEPEGGNANGTPYCRISVATNESYRDKEGKKVILTEWHKVTFWKSPAEFITKYVKKGNTVMIEGKLKTKSYTDKDGETRYITEIAGETIKLLEKPEKPNDLPMF
jgi:single-strand DNA-binding protein